MEGAVVSYLVYMARLSPVPSCLMLYCPVSSCFVLSCPAMPCLMLSCPVVSRPVLSYAVLSCPAPPAPSCPALCCPVPPCPVRLLPDLLCGAGIGQLAAGRLSGAGWPTAAGSRFSPQSCRGSCRWPAGWPPGARRRGRSARRPPGW